MNEVIVIKEQDFLLRDTYERVVEAYETGEYHISFRFGSSNYGEGYTVLERDKEVKLLE